MDDAPPPPPRPRLTAERVVDEAFALVDRDGTEAFSFRVLAGRLGVQAMSLYHYFPSKAHLFEAMVMRCIAEMPPLPETGPWRDRLMRAALDYRAVALRHPGFFTYFSIFRQNNAAGLAWLDSVLRLFEATGLPPDRRALHFRTIGYYLAGAGLEEALGYARGPSSADPVPDDVARRDYPAIMAVGPWFAPAFHEPFFLHGLNALLDAIEADVARCGGRASG